MLFFSDTLVMPGLGREPPRCKSLPYLQAGAKILVVFCLASLCFPSVALFRGLTCLNVRPTSRASAWVRAANEC